MPAKPETYLGRRTAHFSWTSERNHLIPYYTLPWRFLRTRDEGSFNGFKGRRSDNDSDLDHGSLEDNGGGPAPGFNKDGEENAQWTDYLSNFQAPAFTVSTSIILTNLIILIL